MKIEREVITSRIYSYFNLQITLAGGIYYMTEVEDGFYYISYSPEDNQVMEDSIINGVTIMEIQNDKLNLYPSISNLMNIEASVVVSGEILEQLSRGYTIDLDASEPIIKIIDEKSRFVALVRKSDDKYIPMTDLGFYLRNEG